MQRSVARGCASIWSGRRCCPLSARLTSSCRPTTALDAPLAASTSCARVTTNRCPYRPVAACAQSSATASNRCGPDTRCDRTPPKRRSSWRCIKPRLLGKLLGSPRRYQRTSCSASRQLPRRAWQAGAARVSRTRRWIAGAHPLLVPPRLVPRLHLCLRRPQRNTSTTRERRFVYLSNVRSPSTRNISLRLFSKLPKLSPHILFPRKWTVFFDSKLHMRASMGELWAVYVSRVLQPWRAHNYSIGHEDIMPFTAIIHPYAWIRDVARHPCCEASRRRLGGKEFLQMGDQSAFSFMQTEARLLLTPKPKPCTQSPCVKAFKPLRVANASILRHQIERYAALSTTAAGRSPTRITTTSTPPCSCSRRGRAVRAVSRAGAHRQLRPRPD